MKKLLKTGILCASAMMLISGCANNNAIEGTISPELREEILAQENTGIVIEEVDEEEKPIKGKETKDAIKIELSDEKILVNNEIASDTETNGVCVKNDIIYYESGKDFTYGEGKEEDSHTKEEAKNHKVIHITKPGTYEVSGTLSYGQIAIDLGEDAKENTEAVVNLILNGADITCDVAPAIIFYNVYECGDKNIETATKDVDTANAGANLILADGSKNYVDGSYVAKIYKSFELNEDKTKVVDSKKLHKYDGAVYSKMSMNIDGQEEKDGKLVVYADNEGVDSELHLTMNGGYIKIVSGNDGINTNEDGVSVTTINDGNLRIFVNGKTGEGDGIDSNGWLVINGGRVVAEACSSSGDAGIDSDMGIHINGGRVLATGNMLDRIDESEQNYIVLNFEEKQNGKEKYLIKDLNEDQILSYSPKNQFNYMILSSNNIKEEEYTIWKEDQKLEGIIEEDNAMRKPPMMDFKHDEKKPEFKPDDFNKQDKFNKDMENEFPKDFNKSNHPNKEMMDKIQKGKSEINVDKIEVFKFKKGGNYISSVSIVKQTN